MAHFYRVLNWKIKHEIEKQHNVDYEELVQLAIKIEQTLKRKRNWTQSSSFSLQHKDKDKLKWMPKLNLASQRNLESKEVEVKGNLQNLVLLNVLPHVILKWIIKHRW